MSIIEQKELDGVERIPIRLSGGVDVEKFLRPVKRATLSKWEDVGRGDHLEELSSWDKSADLLKNEVEILLGSWGFEGVESKLSRHDDLLDRSQKQLQS